MNLFKSLLKIVVAIVTTIIFYVFVYQPMQATTANNITGVGNANGIEESNMLTIRMLDVRHGDAILLQDGKQNIMIDVGDFSNEDKLWAGLNKYDISKINTVIISHHHRDHMGNIMKVLGRYKVHRVYDNGIPNSRFQTSMKLHDMLNKGNYNAKRLKAGDRINFGKNFWIDVLAPGEFYHPDWYNNINNTSLIMKLHYGTFTMMFTGDAENPVEVAVADKYGAALKSDILKVGHHGSRTSSNYQFISKVQPQYALISCGQFERYHHPNRNVVGSLEHIGAKVYSTQQNGDLTVKTDGKSFTVNIER